MPHPSYKTDLGVSGAGRYCVTRIDLGTLRSVPHKRRFATVRSALDYIAKHERPNGHLLMVDLASAFEARS